MRDSNFSLWIYNPIIIIMIFLIMTAPAWSVSVPIQNQHLIIQTNHDGPISSVFGNLSTSNYAQSEIINDDMGHLTFNSYHSVNTDDQDVTNDMSKASPIPETSMVIILLIGSLVVNFFRRPSYRGIPNGNGINSFKGGLGSSYT